MHSRIRFIAAAALGLALTGSLAHAQLLLSGHTSGTFTDLSEANTTVVNASDGSWATFATGIPYGASTQSMIVFQNASFTDVGSGDPIQVGLFDITNGRTLVGSGAPTAEFNLALELTSPVTQTVAITPVLFHIDHTPNVSGGIPDTFSVSFDQPMPVKIGDYLVQFHVNVSPQDFEVREDTTVQKGDITVTFSPVPEPSTYAALGAAMLLGLVALRRFRPRVQPATVA